MESKIIFKGKSKCTFDTPIGKPLMSLGASSRFHNF
jgi:hypothetical protein